MTAPYLSATEAPLAADVQAWPGRVLLEFGTDWCGHCRAAQAPIAQALAGQALRHVKVEDGPGRPLGRHFRVKLWPTLILLQDGQEIARTVRPTQAEAVQTLLQTPSA